ncbi:aspartate/glutamate racemase family protein [Planctomycetota bacterium]
MSSKSPTIGIIGGMGPWASLYMFECILQEWSAEKEQDYPHIILDSNPGIPDRTSAITGEGEDPFPYIEKSAIRLMSQGVEILAMACNTAHFWYEKLKREVECEFPSIIETAVNTVFEETKDPLRTSIGILATDGTIQSGIYQKEIERQGMKCIVPDGKHQSLLMEAVYGKDGIKLEGGDSKAGQMVRDAAEHLRSQGSDFVIAGCTELPLVLKGIGNVIDPMRETAKNIVGYALP